MGTLGEGSGVCDGERLACASSRFFEKLDTKSPAQSVFEEPSEWLEFVSASRIVILGAMSIELGESEKRVSSEDDLER